MFKHIVLDDGAHHIELIQHGVAVRVGERVNWQAIASLNAAGKSAIAVTEHHSSGPLEPEVVYFVERQ